MGAEKTEAKSEKDRWETNSPLSQLLSPTSRSMDDIAATGAAASSSSSSLPVDNHVSTSSTSSTIVRNYPLLSAFAAFVIAQCLKVVTAWYVRLSLSIHLDLFNSCGAACLRMECKALSENALKFDLHATRTLEKPMFVVIGWNIAGPDYVSVLEYHFVLVVWFERSIRMYVNWPPVFNQESVFCPAIGCARIGASLYKDRRWDARQLIGSGGMPSSHSATVTALAIAIGFQDGFAGSLFATAAILACVVMYDSSGVRLHAGRQAEVLNQIVFELPAEHPLAETRPLRELLGHTPPQLCLKKPSHFYLIRSSNTVNDAGNKIYSHLDT
ncbi:hypothetical protein ACLOJK_012042 [Asimina triloba]